MLDKLFQSFRKKNNANDDDIVDPLPNAFAALLVEAARADEDYTDNERALIDHILAAQFSVDAKAAQSIREEAEAAQAEANDLYGFSRVVKDNLDHEEKLKLIEDMWVIALSDERSEPYEEMIIRRLIGLIYLDDRDSALAKKRAAVRL